MRRNLAFVIGAVLVLAALVIAVVGLEPEERAERHAAPAAGGEAEAEQPAYSEV